MAAATADRDACRKGDGGELLSYGLTASETVYAGTFVLTGASDGYLKDGVSTYPAASYHFAGVAFEGGTCSSTAASTACRVWKDGVFKFYTAGTTVLQAHVGDECYLHDNQTVRMATVTSTSNIKVGTITEIDTSVATTSGSAMVWVRIDNYTV